MMNETDKNNLHKQLRKVMEELSEASKVAEKHIEKQLNDGEIPQPMSPKDIEQMKRDFDKRNQLEEKHLKLNRDYWNSRNQK